MLAPLAADHVGAVVADLGPDRVRRAVTRVADALAAGAGAADPPASKPVPADPPTAGRGS
jgi:hypothetical protein